MIDQHHKMAGLVAHLMQYYGVRKTCSIQFPADGPTETPDRLGFIRWWRPLDGMQEDWQQSAHLPGETPCVLHLCKDALGGWFAYIAHGWKNGPFEPSSGHPAIAGNVSMPSAWQA